MAVTGVPGATSQITGPSGGFTTIPVKPQVQQAVDTAASAVTSKDLKGKKVEGMLLGEYFPVGAVRVGADVNPRHLPASALICMGGELPEPGQSPLDPNTAQHYYLKIGGEQYGPLPFANPLVSNGSNPPQQKLGVYPIEYAGVSLSSRHASGLGGMDVTFNANAAASGGSYAKFTLPANNPTPGGAPAQPVQLNVAFAPGDSPQTQAAKTVAAFRGLPYRASIEPGHPQTVKITMNAMVQEPSWLSR